MTPDELTSFLLPHTSQICRTTPALFRYIPGRENHFGSGVLLRVGETPFMLTAAHVADELRDMKWKGIYFGTPDFEPLSVGTVKFLCSKPGKDPFRGDDPIDVAVVELSAEIAGKLSAFMRFLSPDDLLLDPQSLQHGTYLVNGFPDSRVEKDEMEETIIAQNLPYITYLHKSDQPPIPDFRPLNNIALQATKPYQDGEFSFGIDLKFTEGMSGGVSGGCMTKPSRFRHLIGKRRNLSGLLPRAPIRATKVRVTIFGAQKSDV